MKFSAQVIRPKEILNAKRTRAQILNALNKTGGEAKKLLGYTTSAWKGDRPSFTVEPVRYAGGDARLRISVGPEGSEGFWKWVWLNYGTRVRYATMTRNFVAKTRVGSFYSRPGRGGMAYVSKRHPHRGIQARRWGFLIEDVMARRLTRRIDQAIREQK